MATKIKLQVVVDDGNAKGKFDNAAKGAQNLDDKNKELGSGLDMLKGKYLAVAGAVAGFLLAAKKGLEAQSEQVRVVNNLNLALANQGNFSDQTSLSLQKYASALQDVSRFGDEAILQGMSLLATTGLNEEQLKRSTLAAANFAEATGKDLTMSMELLSRAALGQTGTLSRYGIIVEKGKDNAETFERVLAQLEQRFAGAAKANVENFSGAVTQMNNNIGDAWEGFGKLIDELFNVTGFIQNYLVPAFGWIAKFLKEDMIIAISEARAGFATVSGVVAQMAADSIGFIQDLINGGVNLLIDALQKFGIEVENVDVQGLFAEGLRQDLEEFAQGAIIAADAIREEGNQAALTSATLDDLKNRVPPVREETEDLKDEVEDFTRALVDNSFGAKKAKLSLDDFKLVATGLPTVVNKASGSLDGWTMSTVGLKDATDDYKASEDEARDATEVFGSTLGDAGKLMNLFGIETDSVAGKIISWGQTALDVFNSVLSLISNLTGGMSGLGGIFGSFFGGGGGGGGLFGGLGGLLGGGGLIGLGIGGAVAGIAGLAGLFGGGRDAGTVREEGRRDMGQEIGDALADRIHESGLNPQAFVGDIFREQAAQNKLNADRLAEEIGDIFSVHEQGKLSEGEAKMALENAIPLLLENFDKLTEQGQEQVERIIGASEHFGIAAQGIEDLADALGGNGVPAPVTTDSAPTTTTGGATSTSGKKPVQVTIQNVTFTVEPKGGVIGTKEEIADAIRPGGIELVRRDSEFRREVERIAEEVANATG